MGKVLIPSSTAFTLLMGSGVASGIDHPGKQNHGLDKDDNNSSIGVRNVMDDTKCRDEHLYNMVTRKLPYIYHRSYTP